MCSSSLHICFFITHYTLTYNFSGGDFMKDQSLIITEHHSIYVNSPDHAIRQTITAWLTKELHK